MLRVRNLRELARQRDLGSFTAQLGPIVLMQKPPSEAGAERARAGRSMATVPLPPLTVDALPAMGRFDSSTC